MKNTLDKTEHMFYHVSMSTEKKELSEKNTVKYPAAVGAGQLSVMEKLRILTDAAKYDVACTSSGVERKGSGKGMGNTKFAGICHSFSADGKSNDVERTAFTPEEICELTMNFYKRNYIEGLFLSSGIIRDPSYTMELI